MAFSSNGQPWLQQSGLNSSAQLDIIDWSLMSYTFDQYVEKVSVFVTNSVYLAGMQDPVTKENNRVYSAPIDQLTGLIGNFSQCTDLLPISVQDATPVIIKPYVYLFGGMANVIMGDPLYSSILRAEIYDDGNLGEWEELAATLAFPTIKAQVYVSSAYIYLFGGFDGNLLGDPPNGKVQRAAINQDGSLEQFVEMSANTLPLPIENPTIIHTGSRVYAIGGGYQFYPPAQPSPCPFVYYAPINPNGTIGSWVSDQDIPFRVSGAKAITTTNRVFLVGGQRDYPEPVSPGTIYSAPIINGVVGEWLSGNEPIQQQHYVEEANIFVTEAGAYVITYEGNVLKAPFSGGLNNYINMSVVDVNVEEPLPEINISAHNKGLGNEVTFQEPVPSVKVSIAPSISVVDYVPQIEVTALQGKVVSVTFDDLLPIISIEVESDQQQNGRVVEVLFSDSVPEIIVSAQAAKITNVSISEPAPEIKINAANGFIVNVVAEEGTPVIRFVIETAVADDEIFVHGSPVKQGTLCMNALNRATTQFTNHQFTSYANFNGMILGTTEEGLFSVCSAARDGVDDIDAHVVFPATDFDVQNTKRLRAVYFGYSSDGQLKLSYSFDYKPTTTYNINAHKTNLQRIRIPVNREQYGRYLTKVKIENISGSDFYLDQVEALSVILASRRR